VIKLKDFKPPFYGSDFIVDVLKKFDFKYITFNPGSTFRGLHDSIVNYGGNESPEVILCNHEKIAVQMAHGYSKVAGKPLLVACHDTVGLLHATNAIYYAYIDRVPMVILGASGPMDVTRRRPKIDWIHTVLINGNLLRGFVKWDDQPFTLESVPESIIRAYRTATMEPKGPVYVCFDVAMQEDPTKATLELPRIDRFISSSRIQGEPALLKKTAQLLLEADLPVIVPEFSGRNPQTVESLIQLTELMAAPVYDLEGRFNFPNTHPMDLTGSDVIERADLILMLDVRQPQRVLKKMNQATRKIEYIIRDDAKIVNIGLEELRLTGLMQELGRIEPSDISITADTSIALPSILSHCEKMLTDDRRVELRNRYETITEEHNRLRVSWLEQSKRDWNSAPISPSRIASEIWSAVRSKDWAVTGKNLNGWIRKTWEMTNPQQFFGWSLGTATGIGLSLGVALAYKDTNTLVVDVQADGDLMYDCGALWVGAHEKIPMLVVMYNNRAYGNSLRHQSTMAKQRGRNEGNAFIGTEIDNPAPDFVQLARSMGCKGIGPIEDPDGVRPAVEEAIELMEKHRVPVLIDAICG